MMSGCPGPKFWTVLLLCYREPALNHGAFTHTVKHVKRRSGKEESCQLSFSASFSSIAVASPNCAPPHLISFVSMKRCKLQKLVVLRHRIGALWVSLGDRHTWQTAPWQGIVQAVSRTDSLLPQVPRAKHTTNICKTVDVPLR